MVVQADHLHLLPSRVHAASRERLPHNVIHISEVALAISVIEDLDGLAFTELVGKTEVCHIGTTGRTMDGEETETC